MCKQDDILIGGKNHIEKLEILEQVLSRLSRCNVHLKLSKCEFLKQKVTYLGLEIGAEGIRPVESKISAVRNAPVPENLPELRSFLGMIRFLPFVIA